MENSNVEYPMQDSLDRVNHKVPYTPDELKACKCSICLAVGSIMYAVRCTRPDVAFAQNITSRFQQNPGDLHWTTVKNILKYLRNTKDMFLVYGGAVDWKSAKQSIFATSSAEAEYIAAFDASKEAVWVRKFISGLVYELSATPTPKWELLDYFGQNCLRPRIYGVLVSGETGHKEGLVRFLVHLFLGDKRRKADDKG
ncbi:hypothetical protein Tco_0001178 [Tanacetum coccineum]